MTFEQAIKLAKERVGDIYEYMSLERIKNHDYITFVCEKHGEQRQRLDGHFKHGCPWCARMRNNQKNFPLAYGKGVNDVANVWNVCRKAFSVWRSMLARCYDAKYQKSEPSYIGCTVCDEWLLFSNFLKWFGNNYIEGYQLDKDIIHKGNKIYSPQNCAFVPREINSLLLYKRNKNSNLPIGVMYEKRRGYYFVNVKDGNKYIYCGSFNDKLEAFKKYKEKKEEIIKQRAYKYKDSIDVRVYNALMNYEVEITN